MESLEKKEYIGRPAKRQIQDSGLGWGQKDVEELTT